jgi:hypothetical protein
MFLKTIEDTALSTWIRESASLWGFPWILTMHTFGIAILVGASTVLDLRILGFGPDIAVAPLKKLHPFAWLGFWLNVASGLLLLYGQPTKMLTNPVFYIKMVVVALGMVVAQRIHHRLFDAGANADSEHPEFGYTIVGLVVRSNHCRPRVGVHL